MRRKLFSIMVAVSAVLCIATAALWLRSYWASTGAVLRKVDYDGRNTEWTFCKTESAAGCVAVAVIHRMQPGNRFGESTPVKGDWSFAYELSGNRPSYPGYSGPDYAGLQLKRFTYPPPDFYRGGAVTLPYWLLCPSFALAPALWAGRRVIQSRRAARGRCPVCGYDLRATPDRCPECGTATASPATAPPPS